MKSIRLSKLIKDIATIDTQWDRDIKHLTLDSREVQPGSCFVACVGLQTKGHDFIEAAAKAGAVAILCEAIEGFEDIMIVDGAKDKLAVIPIPDLNAKLGEIAARFYDYPTQTMRVVGITGTNGKTSTSYFIAEALTMAGFKAGVIGTMGYGFVGELKDAMLTTPNQIALHRMFRELKDQGAQFVVMEVSSHGLDQQRVNGVNFELAVFTNLTRDHLDYHKSLTEYGQAKRKLFLMPGLKAQIINMDDHFGQKLIEEFSEKLPVYGYSAVNRRMANNVKQVRAHQVNLDNKGITAGLHTPWGDGVMHSNLIGRFFVGNLLATLTALVLLDIPFQVALSCIAKLNVVPGRMERYGGEQGRPTVVVDFAHTPDALKHVLQSLREYCNGELWCVFGCGGNRDAGKRPDMGEIAEQHADHIILTNDNPRLEDPNQIVSDIMQNMSRPEFIVVELDRERAIKHAIACANPEDIILVAGKGHEHYQIIGKEKRPFNDSVTVQMVLAEAK